ncbi:MAG: hypothetical protein Q4A49_05035 [Neisseria sp.]|nr:hypothetical protein [Neisseria sp.]
MSFDTPIDYAATLSRLLPRQHTTIACHILENGEKVWLRKVGKTVPQWRYVLLGMLSRRLKLGALQPVPNLGGQTALDTEACRLQHFAVLGIPAPKLLAQQKGGLLFSHLGDTTLLNELEHAADPIVCWQDGLYALAAVHAKGSYLSQAFVRNIIRMPQGNIGFIDFEDDPGSVMSLENCQIRDWLCYLQSSVIWLKQRGLMCETVAAWQNHEALLPPEIRRQLYRSTKKIAFLRGIESERFGNDTLRLAAMAELFYRCG